MGLVEADDIVLEMIDVDVELERVTVTDVRVVTWVNQGSVGSPSSPSCGTRPPKTSS